MLRTDDEPFPKRTVGGAKLANNSVFYLNITNTMKFRKYFPASRLSEAAGTAGGGFYRFPAGRSGHHSKFGV